ncbi:hypothetical protein BCR42DRAFT_450257 [Absidia repens]|uniref:P-type Ca(2+) transporter n=1 Tax=Absidia repens TaxID=90262 RepID=A0A1X2IJG3_9FUNG|nr:hypothetical protein BCR42DRAFT_450257 [Absidia repens]
MPNTAVDESQPLLAGFSGDNNAESFDVTVDTLSSLVESKNKEMLDDMGGVIGLCHRLKVDPSSGLFPDEGVSQSSDLPFAKRKATFGENILPHTPPKSFLELLWCAYNDKTLFMLTIAALISLGIGLWKDNNDQGIPDEPKVGWIEGTAILIAVIVVVLTNAINDYQRESQFKKLNAKHHQNQFIKVLRGGRVQRLHVQKICVGDIVDLVPGDVVPFDGIYLHGYDLACDESSLTGESNTVKKQTYDNSLVAGMAETDESLALQDCFILSGSRVLLGVGRVVVVAVGVNSFFGKTMVMTMTLNQCHQQELTPLQQKLDVLADQIAWFGLISAFLIFVILSAKFFIMAWWFDHSLPAGTTIAYFIISTVIEAITIIVVAVPEGLPMAVTLALAFATTQMLKDNNLVRVLAACETMGNATTVCTDKTGTLTKNKMTVVECTFGETSFKINAPTRFDDEDDNDNTNNSNNNNDDDEISSSTMLHHKLYPFSDYVRKLIKEGVAINSTAYKCMDDQGRWQYTGSKTECALLEMVEQWQDITSVDSWRQDTIVDKIYPFSSQNKSMTSIIRLTSISVGNSSSAATVTSSLSSSTTTAHNATTDQPNSVYRLHTKGAPEALLEHCTRYMDEQGQVHLMEHENYVMWDQIIRTYAQQALRTMALAYQDLTTDAYEDFISKNVEMATETTPPLQDLILLGVVGIRDPLRSGVVESVAAFRRAGVSVRMITGDNIYTAKAIATSAGILTEGGMALIGPEFRTMSEDLQRQVVPQMQVLARSSPHDKMTVVARLQELDQVVAMTGDGTNDGPALKLANIGFSMNLAGSEVAKEASDIILMDDNFNSILKALLWGRAVNDGIRKFLTFQLTVNVAAVVLTLVSAIASEQSESILGAVQLLWINLIMDTLAALALATEPPTDALLDQAPIKKTEPVIDGGMAYRILSQGIFQVCITLAVMHYSPFWFGLDPHQQNNHDYLMVRSMVFNTFVFLQFFNGFNCRRIHGTTLNVFEHLNRDWLFLAIQALIAIGQVCIITFGGSALKTSPLTPLQWVITVGIGFCSLPVGWLFTSIARIPRLQNCGYYVWHALIRRNENQGWHNKSTLPESNSTASGSTTTNTIPPYSLD